MNAVDRAWGLRQDAEIRGRKVATYYFGHDEWLQLLSIPYSPASPVRHMGDGFVTVFGVPALEVHTKSHVGASEVSA